MMRKRGVWDRRRLQACRAGASFWRTSVMARRRQWESRRN